MGQKDNWKLFIDTTKAKAESHEKVAQYWNTVNTYLGLTLILLSAITTVLAAIKDTPKMATVGISGVTTLVSAIAGFLQPSSRKQIQCDAAKEFRQLMIKMIRCETDREYETLWQQYSKILMTEPFLPRKYKVKVTSEFSMTPELSAVIDKKEEAVGSAQGDSEKDKDDGENKNNGNSTVPDDKINFAAHQNEEYESCGVDGITPLINAKEEEEN